MKIIPLFLATILLPTSVNAEPTEAPEKKNIATVMSDTTQEKMDIANLISNTIRVIDHNDHWSTYFNNMLTKSDQCQIEDLLFLPASDIPLDKNSLNTKLNFFRRYKMLLEDNISQAKRTRKKLDHAVTKLEKYINDMSENRWTKIPQIKFDELTDEQKKALKKTQEKAYAEMSDEELLKRLGL
ncbi:MAG: hypothetical protein N0E59_02340 [Candidatus Thiodiazotropha taylori]|nr:hypothetical protein [Candidatus Thiodiazotropha taylori]MCG8051901.1 hypothetical protein [Candidatus Thiodiazotropha taylori]MCG8107010.1 hypothetical protein [Candidatus Thiodiazotropha taylori]MCG8109579.1 hypothetical protein [Candidatus Thiodiazotropha taylori]MCW4279346.1 hypothetical protein [Candidatus Thiodiazotropha taylori]